MMPRMKSHELCRELLQKSNAKELASALGLSPSLIYKWAEPSENGGSGTLNPLDRVEQLLELTKDVRIAEWVCERAGGCFVPDADCEPKAPKNKKAYSLTSATNETVQDFAEMLATIATAAMDNSIDPKEADEIRAHWQQLKSTTEEFVRWCEEGRFEEIRAKPGKG